ncbi:MAG: hypothetical protein K9K67_16225 [Bacteriovoracaceae bacterium]|nr:hypothetical protein [Bacteriovoracaceae bacterium]
MNKLENNLEIAGDQTIDDLFMYYRDYAKFPYSTIKIEKLTREEKGSVELLRYLIDFGSESIPKHNSTEAISTPNGTVKFAKSTSIHSYHEVKESLKFSDWLKVVENELYELIKSQRFYTCQYPANPRDGFAFWLDSRNKWPAWYLMGTSSEFNGEISGSHKGPSGDETGIEIEEKIFGYRRCALRKIKPLVIFRFLQDLIRIEQNRIVKRNDTESIFVSFEQGLVASFYLSNSKPLLRYRLFNKRNIEIGSDVVSLEKDSLRNGVYLALDADKTGEEIASSSVFLELGGGLVDYSEGHYIRGFKVNVEAQQ